MIPILMEDIQYREKCEELARHLNSRIIEDIDSISDDMIYLGYGSNGLSLNGGDKSMQGDFSTMLPRLRPGNLQNEMLIKAVRIKKHEGVLKVIDATAGMGEDSLILAAAGFDVTMYEYNPVIAALLKDSVDRAKYDEILANIVGRMHLCEGDSIKILRDLEQTPDVILLDPMFPERSKSALIKKKFQLLQQLEQPCTNEEELLEAAISAKPKKIVIKRPVKGPALAGKKPDFSYSGKAIRYDCLLV